VTHLELLNVVLTWRFEQPGWPPVLAHAGYIVDAVGVCLFLPDRRRKIVPEVVATCADRGFTALIEVKSGRNAEDDQLRRMLEISPADLRDLNHLSIPGPEKHNVFVVYVCNAGELDRFAAQVNDDRVGVVGFDGTRYSLAGSFPDQELARELAAAVVPSGGGPLPIVPFDQDSSPATIARCVLPELVAVLTSGGGVVSVDGILMRTHGVVLEVMRPTGSGSGAELKSLRRRVVEVINDAMGNEFSAWFERLSQDQSWRFKRSLPHDSAGKTRDLQTLRRAADQLLARLGETPSIQLTIPFVGPTQQ